MTIFRVKTVNHVIKSCGLWNVVVRGTLSIVVLTLAVIGYGSGYGDAQQTKSNPGVTPEIAKKFPEGPGKATFLKDCSNCHSPMNVMASGQTREGWEDTITKMVGFGAQGNDEEFTEILQYLERNFPPQQKTNINAATAAQLEKNLQLEQSAADAIVAYRDRHGAFKTLDDIKQVPGVDSAILDAKRNLILFN